MRGKKGLSAILLFIFLLGDHSFAEELLDSLTTTDGKTYSSVTIKRSDPSGIDIIYDAGATHIPFEKLPGDIQAKYGYSPEKAAQFKEQQTAAQKQLQDDLMADAHRADVLKLVEQLKGKKQVLSFTVDEMAPTGFLSHGLTETWVQGGGGIGDGRGPAYYTTKSRSDGSECLITEVDTSKLALHQDWNGVVFNVGVEKFKGIQVAHYTADLKLWASKQGVKLP